MRFVSSYLPHRGCGAGIGAQGVVCLPIVNGQGKVRLADSVWLTDGPNLPEGTHVIVKSVHETRITVEMKGAD
jgi:inner membrane protein